MAEPVMDLGYTFDSSEARAERLYQAWRAMPDPTPLGPTRPETIKKRIEEGLDWEYSDDVIVTALDKCWKWGSKNAWVTALSIAHRDAKAEPRLSETQRAILRLGHGPPTSY